VKIGPIFDEVKAYEKMCQILDHPVHERSH